MQERGNPLVWREFPPLQAARNRSNVRIHPVFPRKTGESTPQTGSRCPASSASHSLESYGLSRRPYEIRTFVREVWNLQTREFDGFSARIRQRSLCTRFSAFCAEKATTIQSAKINLTYASSTHSMPATHSTNPETLQGPRQSPAFRGALRGRRLETVGNGVSRPEFGPRSAMPNLQSPEFSRRPGRDWFAIRRDRFAFRRR